MALPWYTGIIKEVWNESPNTRRFRIQIPELEVFAFQPGQFVTLDLPIDEKPSRRWRSYSIASWPDGSNIFELIIVRLSGGQGSSYLFDEGRPGLPIPVRGPQGVFTTPAGMDDDIFFICTGTGVAPFRSMLHDISSRKIPHGNLYLIFGTRTRADLLYHDEFSQLEKELEGFHYIPTLSREKWEGRTGYVHSIYEELCTRRQSARFYLCGWKDMIQEARKRIQAMGYDRKAIHQELYG